jgi:hypothetical protein
VYFGIDSVLVFQECRADVIVLLQKEDCPYIFGIHYFVHRTNLAVEPLSNLPIVGKYESLCQSMWISSQSKVPI